MLDPQAITAAFFAVLKSGSAGTAVRAALGDGAHSVIPAEDLKGSLPLAPFLALRGGPIGGGDRDMRLCAFTWWIYDDPNGRFYGINGLIPLIVAAYPLRALASGATRVTGIGGEFTDAALSGRPGRSIQFSYTTRQL